MVIPLKINYGHIYFSDVSNNHVWNKHTPELHFFQCHIAQMRWDDDDKRKKCAIEIRIYTAINIAQKVKRYFWINIGIRELNTAR